MWLIVVLTTSCPVNTKCKTRGWREQNFQIRSYQNQYKLLLLKWFHSPPPGAGRCYWRAADPFRHDTGSRRDCGKYHDCGVSSRRMQHVEGYLGNENHILSHLLLPRCSPTYISTYSTSSDSSSLTKRHLILLVLKFFKTNEICQNWEKKNQTKEIISSLKFIESKINVCVYKTFVVCKCLCLYNVCDVYIYMYCVYIYIHMYTQTCVDITNIYINIHLFLNIIYIMYKLLIYKYVCVFISTWHIHTYII